MQLASLIRVALSRANWLVVELAGFFARNGLMSAGERLSSFSKKVNCMNFMVDILCGLSNFMKPHFVTIGVALTATVLILYGNDINRAVKTVLRRWHFMPRVLLFVAICSFGYGGATILGGTLFYNIIRQLSPAYQSPIIMLLFIGVGILAERKNHV